MAFFDLSGSDLKSYRSAAKKPFDFEAFWISTLALAREWDLGAEFLPVRTGLVRFSFYDASFTGFGGQRVKAWYAVPLPCGADGSPRLDGTSRADGGSGSGSGGEDSSFPVVLQYIGYGGGRGVPADWLPWLAAGCAVFAMDTRGQGSVWRTGDTPDGGQRPDSSDEPQIPGFMTRGIGSPETYYYTRVFVDAARAVEAAAAAPGADPSRIVITGGSQGGGLSIAAAALSSPGAFDAESIGRGWERPAYSVRAVMPDVPFLCDIPRAVGLVDSDPYNEIVRYLKTHRTKADRVFRTLSYIDCVHLASVCRMPALFSVGLMDTICPPSTVYAAYNAWAGEKSIIEYPYNNHEGGQSEQFHAQLEFVPRFLA